MSAISINLPNKNLMQFRITLLLTICDTYLIVELIIFDICNDNYDKFCIYLSVKTNQIAGVVKKC